MSKNQNGTKRNKSFFSIIRLCFVMSLLVYCIVMGTTSFGWFAQNDKVSGNGLNFTTESGNVKFNSVNYYVVNEISKNASNVDEYSFVPLQKEDNKFYIPTYDPQGLFFSPYKQIIVININYTISGNSNLGLYFCAEDHLANIFNPEDNYTSNILQVKIAEKIANQDKVTQATNTDTRSFTELYNNNGAMDVRYNSNDNIFQRNNNEIELKIMDTIPQTGTLWLIVEYNKKTFAIDSKTTTVIDFICDKIQSQLVGNNANTTISYTPDTIFKIK